MSKFDTAKTGIVSNSSGDFTPRQRFRLPNITRTPPPKTTIAAILLLVVGTTMLIAGLVLFFEPEGKKDKGVSLMALGSLSKLSF